ncbi:ATP-binding protein [Hydrogenimonas urashimensis]|uniref:sensor histidine kinase n=1 Tax=Hydrogenimonas urashimensis TaxID=2740515 RepID=UPI001915B9CE|nr:ATP-binding protein [Hydrogenimonas urashimensis]
MLNRYLKLSQIFFINFILLLGGVMSVATFVIYYSIQQIEIEQYTNQLKSEIAYVSLQQDKGKTLEQAAKEMSEIMGRPLRVTLIAMDGTPLFDNEADTKKMANHANRPEVKEAKREGFGIAVRYSETIGNDRIYAAKVIKWHGKPAILRLSVALDTVMSDFGTLWVRIAFVFFVALMAGLYMSWMIRWRIDEELEKITDYLQHLADKKYGARFLPGFTAEFRTIGKLLKKLSKRLEKNERKRRKYTAKLRLIGKQRSDIISAIGHEFKNPVAAIMGYTETLLGDPDLSLQMRKKFLERIEQNSRRIIEMIDRLAFVTRLENSEIEPRMSRFDFEELVKDVAAALEQKYAGRHIRIKSAPVTVFADRTMMEMAVSNLMDNALKYSQDDIVVDVNEKEFCIADRGQGIAKKEIAEITKKFYRVDKNSWDNSMGLGLAIVTYILRLHHSFLRIESDPGVGTHICFDIPSICDIKKNERSRKFV